MKHILNEKFILSEKFILTEADEPVLVDADKLAQTLNSKTYSRENINQLIIDIKLHTQNKDLADKLLASKKSIDNLDAAKAGKDNVKAEINKYLELFKQYFTQGMLMQDTEVKNNYDALTNLIDDENSSVTDLKSTFKLFSGAISVVLGEGNLDKATSDKLVQNLVNFTDLLDEAKESINTLVKVQLTYDEIRTINPLITNCNNTLNTEKYYDFSKESDLKNITKYVEEDTKVLAAFQNACAQFTLNNKALNNTDKNQDWQKLLDDAGEDQQAIKKVWDNYFSTVWGTNTDFVHNLGEAFTIELLSMGFSEKLNPFITFIKKAIELHLPLNATSYSQIHNAFVKQYLTRLDLIADDKSPFNIHNIIFCTDFYNQVDYTRNEYIIKQYDLKFKTIDSLTSDKVQLAGQYNNDVEFREAVQTMIFFKDGNTGDADTLGTPGHINSGLKSITEVNEEFIDCFGHTEDSKAKVSVNVDDQTSIINSLKTLFPDKTAEVMAKEICAVYITAPQDFESIKKLLAKASVDISNYSLSVIDRLILKDNYNKILNRFKMDAADIKAIIKALLKIKDEATGA